MAFLGEKYQDKSHELPKRWKGKQFVTNPPKKASGNAVGYFNGLKYSPEPYGEDSKYVKQQPLDSRKLGFGSHDARKRDEFMSHIRTECYREQLRSELRNTSKQAEGTRKLLETMGGSEGKSSEDVMFAGTVKPGERDLALASAGRAVLRASLAPPAGSIHQGSMYKTAAGLTLKPDRSVPSLGRTAFDVAKDQRSPRSVYGLERIHDRYQDRVLGSHKPMSLDVGSEVSVSGLARPKFATVSATATQFLDRGHIE
jgi:hypothetical protein